MLEIKDYLSDGLNMAGIKRVYEMKLEEQKNTAEATRPLTDADVRQILYDEILSQGGLTQQNPFQSNVPSFNVSAANKNEGWGSDR